MLNAVGLSNFGAKFYLDADRWQRRTDNFMISFMAVGDTLEERKPQYEPFMKLLREYLRGFKVKPAVQWNLTCPNLGQHAEEDEVIEESRHIFDCAGDLIPETANIPKLNVLISVSAANRIAEHRSCDALCTTNTIKFGLLPKIIDWKKLFGMEESPLKDFGGGGMSGARLLPLLLMWLEEARGVIKKPIIAGGGIMSPWGVRMVSYTHPAAISLGSVSTLRFWRVSSIIHEAYKLF
jgi:dihydroorotate dehydrogenase